RETNLPGGITLADSLLFVAGYEEIFKRENYKVAFSNNKPFIIDCGSSIRLSIIYFKTSYPQSKIIAFEPDPQFLRYRGKMFQNFRT
ncbi:MAG TPA: hypothetical protein VJ765_07410, partial [Chitinophagaceae bacterium]|nr:hypothetical protein [Chitinophagaceae bacterium]